MARLGALDMIRPPPFLALALLACHSTTDRAPQIRYQDQPIPGTTAADATHFTVRVVDARTGNGIPNAVLALVHEQPIPTGSSAPTPFRVQTDVDGLATLPRSTAWLCVQHPDYGPSVDMWCSDRVLPLGPRLDVPVELYDWRGQALTGALAGWTGGCGHVPDLVQAFSDDRGRVLLRGIDPGNSISDLYVDRAPIAFEYDSLRWHAGSAVLRRYFARGALLEGQLLNAAGNPLAGLAVGTGEFHRGPWGLSDEQGRFRVWGLTPGQSFLVHQGQQVFEFAWPARQPCTLRLPADAAQQAIADEGVWTAPEAPAPSMVEVQLEIADLPKDARVSLHEHYSARDITTQVREGSAIAIDSTTEHSLWIEAQDSTRVFAYAAGELIGKRAPQAHWYAPTRVRAQCIDALGQPIAVSASWGRSPGGDVIAQASASDGWLQFPAEITGMQFLFLQPSDPRLHPRCLTLEMPERSDASQLDLGPLRFDTHAVLSWSDAQGRPLRARFAWMRAGVTDWREEPVGSVELSPQGAWQGPEPRDGDVLVCVEREDALRSDTVRYLQRWVYSSKLPKLLVLPNATLELKILDPNGKELRDCSVVLGSQQWLAHGSLRIEDLSAGACRLWVGHAGYRTAVVDAQLELGNTCTIVVQLPRRGS